MSHSSTRAFGQQQLATNHPLAEIRNRAAGKLICLPVQVNGSSPHWFIFDTGAPNSLIDSALAKRLHVSSISRGIIHSAGKGDVPANDAGEVKLTIGGLNTHIPHAKIVDLSKVPLPARGYGLVGAEFLEQYVIRIPRKLNHDNHGKFLLSLRGTKFAGKECRGLGLTCFDKTPTDCLSAIATWLRLIRGGFVRGLLIGQI
jgi:Aspartyl protease